MTRKEIDGVIRRFRREAGLKFTGAANGPIVDMCEHFHAYLWYNQLPVDEVLKEFNNSYIYTVTRVDGLCT